MLGYHVPAPDEAMLVSGGKTKEGASPFKVITGRGAWVLPVFRKVDYLSLKMGQAVVSENCVSQQGIELRIRAVIAFKVAGDEASIVNAAHRFLSNQDHMSALVGEIFSGHLRSIVGSMTVEEIVRERQKLATEVLDGSKAEMAKTGLIVDSFQIQSVDDGDAGYIAAMAAPHNAAIQREAKIAQAEADRLAAEAEQSSARQQAEYLRETEVAKAANQAEVDKAHAISEQAGPLQRARAEQETIAELTALARKRAEQREEELVSEVVKPAEASARKTAIEAEANAERIRIEAEAAQTANRVTLDRMMIEQLPEVAGRIASSLEGANVNVFNGADGVGEIVSGLASQGVTIFDAVRSTLEQRGSAERIGNGRQEDQG